MEPRTFTSISFTYESVPMEARLVNVSRTHAFAICDSDFPRKNKTSIDNIIRAAHLAPWVAWKN